MLEFAKTIPASCKKIKEETYATEQGVQAPFEHIHKDRKLKIKIKKSRFRVRVIGSRNLGLTEGDEQSFVFWNGGARRFLSRLVTWS